MSEDKQDNPIRAAHEQQLNQEQWYQRFIKPAADRHEQEAKDVIRRNIPGSNYDQGVYRPKH